MACLFWGSLVLILYTYAGYPLCLALLRRLKPVPVAKAPFAPAVSVVMSVRNEQKRILGRVEDLLAQDYPQERIEIVVVSDGSLDRTAELVRGHDAGNLRLVRLEQNQGKAAALNAGVASATGEILVFCDARQTFDADVIRELCGNFADQAVGCVSGELLLHTEGREGIQAEMGAYWRYEKWIRGAESDSGSLIGATGAIYAIRRSLYRPLPQGTLLDDVMTPMQVVMQGYRCVFDRKARAHDAASVEASQEWVRKVRTLAGNWQLLALFPDLLKPWKNRCWWRFVSHKLLRLVVPFAMVALLLSGFGLQGAFYRCMTLLQSGFYLLAYLGHAVPVTRSFRVVNLSYFFMVMNLAAVAGFWRWMTGRSASIWQPAYQR